VFLRKHLFLRPHDDKTCGAEFTSLECKHGARLRCEVYGLSVMCNNCIECCVFTFDRLNHLCSYAM
jgi:hypothetical protein